MTDPTEALADIARNAYFDADAWTPGPIDAAIAKAYELGLADGRTAASVDIETVRAMRARTACCKGTGYCGIGDCRSDCAWDDALDAAATAAKGPA